MLMLFMVPMPILSMILMHNERKIILQANEDHIVITLLSDKILLAHLSMAFNQTIVLFFLCQNILFE